MNMEALKEFLVVPESTDPAIMGYQYEADPEPYGMWMWEF